MRPAAMKTFLLPFAAVACALAAPRADAKCPAEPSYTITNSAPNTVVICGAFEGCGSATQTMLREDVATGAFVALANFCDPNSGCYVDECVPEGTYRYGFATPFSCETGECAGPLDYFVNDTVTDPLASSCARSASDPGPTAYASAAPWGATQQIDCPSTQSGLDTVLSGCSTSGANSNSAQLALGALGLALLCFRARKRA